LALAAVWDTCNGRDGVAVLTVPANDLVRPLHDRMPAILTPDRFAAWLDPRERRPEVLLPLLTPYPVELMEGWPVDSRVNSVRVEEPGLTASSDEPSRPANRQPTLFDAA
jgi:putative SOS response-associated peptidase YedK